MSEYDKRILSLHWDKKVTAGIGVSDKKEFYSIKYWRVIIPQYGILIELCSNKI